MSFLIVILSIAYGFYLGFTVNQLWTELKAAEKKASLTPTPPAPGKEGKV